MSAIRASVAAVPPNVGSVRTEKNGTQALRSRPTTAFTLASCIRASTPSCIRAPPDAETSTHGVPDAIAYSRPRARRAQAEVMSAVSAHVVLRAQLVRFEGDAATGAVGRQQHLGQLGALDRDLFALACEDRHQRDRPPSTAITWPVMKPARSEQRNATAAATSSAVASRLIGVIFTSSPTISSVSEPVVSSVRT